MLSSVVSPTRSRWEWLRPAAVPDSAVYRRGLQICLGVVWLLDAALQYQPFMFGPFFVTLGIEPATEGNPAFVADSATWASHVMLRHIVLYNAIFATIQLLIAVGILWRRTIRLALAASIIWSLFVWWFGESLGGVLIGSSPLAGVPGGVVLYALIAVLVWPTDRTPARAAVSPATSSPLGARTASAAWLVLWASFSCYLLLPDNRTADGIAGIFSVTDGQPGWLTWVMNSLSSLAGQRGLEISIVLAIACAVTAAGVFVPALTRPALALGAALGLLFWLAEGLGGIFTGQGTDPNTGLLLILLAACYWPRPASYRQGRHTMACATPN
jgi:hypothetical protein